MRTNLAQVHHRLRMAQQRVKDGRHAANPIAIAKCYATLFTSGEIAQKINPLTASIKAMSTGKGSFLDFVRLSTAFHAASGIEHFRVVKGFAHELQGIERHLNSIGARGGDVDQWKPATLYAEEIKAIRLLATIYKFQLNNISYGEYAKAYDYAVSRVRSDKGEVYKVGELQ